MSMSKQERLYRLVTRLRIRRGTRLLLFMLAIVLLSAGCALIHELAGRAQPVYRCEASLRDARTHEPFRVTSDPSFSPLTAGVTRRFFIKRDWDGDGDEDINDVKTDWRRYIFNRLLPSARFAGRTWCIEPASINCSPNGSAVVTPFPPTALDADALVTCPPETSDAHLEISAPGLTPAPDYRLNFPDTPIGLTSSLITITVRNSGTSALRVNSADLLGGNHEYLIEPLGSGGCQPTESELGRGVGHELVGGGSCSLQVRFRPQFRSGIGECDRDDTVSMFCNRVAPVQITSETLGGITLLPLTLNLNGRAIGGRLVVEPASPGICFPTVPMPGACTDERTITVRNVGARNLTGNITITSAYVVPRDFFATPSLAGITLAPGESRTVRVRYCEHGDRSDGGYRINSSAPRDPTVDVAIVNPNTRTCP